MKCLIQRVNSASVEVENKVVGQISKGILVFLGVGKTDTEAEVNYLVEKIINLRIFPDKEKHFDKSLLEVSGEVLVVSQFTLYANCEKGRRPDFFDSADLSTAEALYNKFINKLKSKNIKTEAGKFGAYMQVKLVNDGPSTFLLEK